MLNSSWNGSYKSVARKADARECSVSSNPLSELIVDFRSRLFRYIRLVYCNRTRYDRAQSVFRTMKDLRLAGRVVTEKRRVFSAALGITKIEVEYMRKCSSVFSCTYVFPSSTACPHKIRAKAFREAKTSDRLDELKKRIELYRRNMFDVDALQQCALALESYLISDLDSLSTLYSGREWLLGVGHFKVPDGDDFFESDRLCAKLARAGAGAAIMSEDLDNVALFGADMMVREVFNGFFVYVSLKDIMTALSSASRTDAVHKCCLLGTDYNRGLKGIGPVKVGKIDHVKAKELFETCLTAQSVKPDRLYELFML